MDKKIKIGFVNYSLGIGGIETLILEIGRRLDKNVYEPSVFVFEKDGKLKMNISITTLTFMKF